MLATSTAIASSAAFMTGWTRRVSCDFAMGRECFLTICYGGGVSP